VGKERILRDRAIIAAMFYTFGRVSAVVNMKVKDYVPLDKGNMGLQLSEKGGNELEINANHMLRYFIDEYLNETERWNEKESLLFPAATRRPKLKLTKKPLHRKKVFNMVRQRARQAGVSPERVSCHAFRKTGITVYLLHGGTLETGQVMAGHASIDTTRTYYDGRIRRVAQEEVEKIYVKLL